MDEGMASLKKLSLTMLIVQLQRPERARQVREKWDAELERRKSMPLTQEAKINAALDKAWQITKQQ